jgi:hypothetical protein
MSTDCLAPLPPQPLISFQGTPGPVSWDGETLALEGLTETTGINLYRFREGEQQIAALAFGIEDAEAVRIGVWADDNSYAAWYDPAGLLHINGEERIARPAGPGDDIVVIISDQAVNFLLNGEPI